jgi:large subunit ribosomal protein L10
MLCSSSLLPTGKGEGQGTTDMSKQIKQMEMDTLKKTFQGIRDMVVLSISGVDSQSDNTMRLGLRKKKIFMHVVKNSLARRVFEEMGLKAATPWQGPTTIAWGADSIAELSKEIEGLIKKNKKLLVKTAIADGTEVTFQQALKMPTKTEAIGRVLMLAMSPARRLVGQILGPGGKVVGQIKSLKDKPAEEAPAEAAPAAPAPA